MTTRTVLRALTADLDRLAKGGILLPDQSRAISVVPSGSVGKIEIIIEQQIELEKS